MESPAKSLPTPPGTSHRAEKENRAAHFPRVAWSERNEIHNISTSPGRAKPLKASGQRQFPIRSILKKVHAQELLPPVDESQREVTPEPSDPLVDLTYLENPVTTIIDSDAGLRDVADSYTALMTRIRLCVPGNTDADSSWPMFQPIRKNREALVDALMRDVGRALEDPLRGVQQEEEPEVEMEVEEAEEEETCQEALKSLPSPKKSPRKKKRRGMSATQVKHARDLCSVSHAALKLLAVVFSMSAVHQLFTERELGFLLTSVLAIPLADSLPTPNARKTCALAIFLIQTQRLPDDVLEPAKDRIVYALRRGIEGELGKEGKKGSINDGLRAIHDLSVNYPAIFLPAFADLLHSIFACLLGPTGGIRGLACTALGGMALAAASIPTAVVHTRIADCVTKYLVDVPPGTPSKKGSPMDDSAIVRTMRTLLKSNEANFPAQGPVWALCLMANFIVLLRSTVFLNPKISHILTAMFSLGVNHVKSSVRGLACLVWRTMIWAYFQPALLKMPIEGESEDEESEEDDDTFAILMNKQWKALVTIIDMGAGISTIGALVATNDEGGLRRALALLKKMSKFGGQNCKDALDVACQLVAQVEEELEWDPMKLLPNPLFSTNPGLMTAEYNQLASTVRPILNMCPSAEDVRPLTEEELCQPYVFMGILNVWMEGLRNLKLFWGCSELPDEITDIWTRLLRVNISCLTEASNEAGIREFADGVIDVLMRILDDEDLDFSTDADDSATSNVLPSLPAAGRSGSWLKYALKLFFVEQLWTTVRNTISRDFLTDAAEKLLIYLAEEESSLVMDVQEADQSHESWASLCAVIALACETPAVGAFFGTKRHPREKKREWEWTPDVRCQMWQEFVKVWSGRQVNWEAGVLLLAIPFGCSSSWQLEKDDLGRWDSYLRFTVDKALDYGLDALTVFDHVGSAITSDFSPTHTSSTGVADILLGHLDLSDAQQVPAGLFEFVNESLTSSYPPNQHDMITSTWPLRSLAKIIEETPASLLQGLLEFVQDGISVWLADEYEALPMEQYECDVLSLYQTMLLSVTSLSLSISTLESLSPALCSVFCGRRDKPETTKEAFSEWWSATYAGKPEFEDSLPDKIVLCLDVIYNRSEASSLMRLLSESPSPSVHEVEEQLQPESEDDDAAEPTTPKVRPLALAYPTHMSISAVLGSFSNPIEIPSTPKSSPRTSPPHRPMKTPKVIDLTSDTPPASPSRVVLGPTTPKRSPEHKRRTNKENVSPVPFFASIAERLASITPGSSTLGKRRASEEDMAETETFKRHKKSMSLSTVIEEDSETTSSEQPSTPQRLPPRMRKMALTNSATLHDSKVRKRKDSDAPGSSPELRKRTSEESLKTSSPKYKDRPTISLRRTRSATRLARHMAAVASAAGPSRKRRRDSFDADESAVQTPSKRSVAAGSSSPSRAAFRPIIAGSDDSIMLATPSGRRSPDIPSSDDDPHIGQVTPHRLVSPAMRRIQKVESADPPSDDSVLVASPTRDHVARRRSAGKAMIEKLAPLMLGKHRRAQDADTSLASSS